MPKHDNEPSTMAMPLMRGFPCPVTTPFMGAAAGPSEGIGCGWANVGGKGATFFITMHAEGGFAMMAELDYARYQRFAENYAGMGRQALAGGKLDQRSDNDVLGALEQAHAALKPFAACMEYIKDDEPDTEWAKFRLEVGNYRAAATALATAAKALMIEEPGND